MKKKIRYLFYNLINSLTAQLRWRLITQRLELRSYKSEIWRKTNAFMSQTSLLFKHWGYSRTDFKNRIICDIGAGPKLRTKFFENAKIAAIEPLGSKFISEYSWSDIKDAWRLYTQPAEKFIPDLENRCDFIVCINVLDHVYDPISVLKNAFRYLKAGGE
ncbi:MAG: methyltransferase domain-containing protein, partial [Candidatus Hadarchaeales archaeon]